MKRQIYFLLWLLLPIWGQAQQRTDTTDALHRVLRHLETYQKNYPQEQIYLHTDRSYYQANDDIWFKAYVTVSQFNFLSAVSKIIYVELLNEQQEVIQSRRLPVVSGLSVGDFKLPESLAEGKYHIRAYTNWMRNFDDGLFFHKTIFIGSNLSSGLLTSASFQFEGKDKQRVLGSIQLTDLKGRSIGNRQVAYELKLDAKNSFKGQSAFNEAGVLQLDLRVKNNRETVLGMLTLNIEDQDRPPVVKSIPIHVSSLAHSIQFFPEGGTLVKDITTKVGFRTLGSLTGMIRGYLEEDGTKILDFKSDSAGLGHFSLSPSSGKTYTAIVSFADGDTIRTILPEVQEEGFGLAINNAAEDVVLAQVSASETLINKQPLALIAQTGGFVYYAVKRVLDADQITFSIPKKSLPSGITKLALLDQEMNLLGERSVFILHPQDTLSVQVSTNKKRYATREKVDLHLSAKNALDSASVGTFSISVVNADRIPPPEDNILSTLLLHTNTYAALQMPFVNLQQTSASRWEQLDNVLLTSKADPAFWKNIQTGKFPEKAYTPEKELKISGTITSNDDKPLDKARVTIVSLQNANAVLDTVTGPDGHFSFDKILFYNQPDFIVQARDARGRKNVKIKLDESPNQEIAEEKNASEVKITASQNDTTRSNKNSLEEVQTYGFDEKSIVLEEVEVKDQKVNPAKYSANLNGPGRADQIISGDELYMRGCPTIDACLQGRLVGVVFRGGVPYSTRSPDRPMQIILDGMYMDANALSIINIFDIASIEVLRTVANTAIYGMYGSGGLMIITTRRGDQPPMLSNDLHSPGITTFSPQGFYEIRAFQSPDYGTEQTQASTEDRRRTLYWQPYAFIDNNTADTFSFYTSDQPGIYRIEVEGLDVDGHLAKSITYIQVE